MPSYNYSFWFGNGLANGNIAYLAGTMAKIKFRQRGSDKIYVYLSLGRGKVYERGTELHCPASNWNAKEGMPKQTLAANKKLAGDLRKLQTHLYEQVNNTEKTINGQWLKEELDIYFGKATRSGHQEGVLYWINDIIENADTRKSSRGGKGLSRSRLMQYKRLKSLFEEFQGGRQYKVKEVDAVFGKEFHRFLVKTKAFGEAYALKTMANLKTVCYEAETFGIETSPQLRKLDAGKPKNEFVIYLTPAELEKIEKADIPQAHLQNARKWLLLGCWIGQRGSDLLRVSEKSIKEENGVQYIELVQQKTGKRVQVPILPQARAIIESGMPHPIAIQNLNNYFKEVCRLAEIDTPTLGSKKNPETNRKEVKTYPKYELIGTHVCRRSFCSNLYGNPKLPTPAIMEVTGHSTEKTFLVYIGKEGTQWRDAWQEFIGKTS